MDNKIIYEQPLTERIRTFLRIEHLFNQVDYYISGEHEFDSRGTISTLLEIIDFLTRSDIKNELCKEIERYVVTLTALEAKPGVDGHRLNSILDEINKNLTILRDTSCQPGQSLRQNEWVISIKQRNSIPGGTCNFDLPGYHCWLHNPPSKRRQIINEWQEDLLIIKDSIKLSLNMIRNSTNPSVEIAEKGFLQKPIDSSTSCQLLRILLPHDSTYYPEISGGRHRFTVRFMQQHSTNERAIQASDDVEFELHCCIL